MHKLVCDIEDKLYKDLKHEAIEKNTTLKEIVTRKLKTGTAE